MSKKTKTDWRFYRSIFFQLIGTSMVTTIWCGLFGFSLVVGLILGIITWAAILFKTPMLGWFFIRVNANYGVVLSNGLKWDAVPKEQTERENFFNRISLREIQAGWRGKWPWETPFGYVDLLGRKIIGEGDARELVLKDQGGRRVRLKYQLILTPLPHYLCQYVQHEDDVSANFFTGICDQFLTNYFIQHQLAAIRARLEKDDGLAKAFNNLFAGEQIQPETEGLYGRWTNKPQVISIEDVEELANADAAKAAATGIGDAAEILKKVLPKADPGILAVLAAKLGGLGDLNPIIIAGGGNFDPRALAELLKRKKNQ